MSCVHRFLVAITCCSSLNLCKKKMYVMKTNTCASTNFSGRLKGILFGLLLVIAGLLFLSFNFGWIDPALKPVLFSWPMLLIVAGILQFSKRDLLMPIVLLIVGVFFLLPRI